MLPAAIFLLALLQSTDRARGANGTTELAPLLSPGDGEQRQDGCHCWVEPSVPECDCQGDQFINLPDNISNKIERLTIQNSGIKVLKNESLVPYKETLKDLTLLNNPYLEELESGLLHELSNLTTLYIVHAPLLQTLHEGLFRVKLPNLNMLRIMHSGLKILPPITQLQTKSHVAMVDLESNKIERLTYRNINISADSLMLNDNQIEAVDGFAFEGSQIRRLTFRGNKALTTLDVNAFYGITDLRDLDLSETSITFLPTRGLHDLEVLKLQNVPVLKVFPSIYNFPDRIFMFII